MTIKELTARQIYDSTGTPTLEVDLITECGVFRIGVPSTDHKKVSEAVQLRDEKPEDNGGMSVKKAVSNVNSLIATELKNQNFEEWQQKEIDEFLIKLDGTEKRSFLGGNAMLGVSLACLKAGASKKNVPIYKYVAELAEVTKILIPCPHFVILAGGILSSNGLPFQEYSILPVGASTFDEAMRIGATVYRYIRSKAKAQYGPNATYCTDVGAMNLPLTNHREALTLLMEAIKKCGFFGKVEIGYNAAASNLFKNGPYDINFKDVNSDPLLYYTPDKLCDFYMNDLKEFSVSSVEDGWECNDWASWSIATSRVPPNMQLIANDLTQTNKRRVELGIEKSACTCMALRINQSATFTEFLDCYKMMKENDIIGMVTDRWGDTEDTLIADIAVGLGCGQIKFGGPVHGERVAKYNQVLRLEEELGSQAKYAGKLFRINTKDK